MQTPPVAQIKKALRKEQLRRLRAWAKAEPAQTAAASRRVCDHVYDYIMARYRPAHTAPTTPVTASHPAAAAPPLFVLAYLPLYFEVDLVPLMQRLWQVAASTAIHIMTPVVLSENFVRPLPTPTLSASAPCSSELSTSVSAAPSVTTTTTTTADAADAAADAGAAAAASNALKSAMAFVEVLDEEDLRTTFAPQGAYGIREFDSAALAAWLLGPDAAASAPLAPSAQASAALLRGDAAGQHQNPATAAPPAPTGEETTEGDAAALSPSHARRRRHVLLCDAYAALFPGPHAAGYRPDGLLEYRHDTADTTTHATDVSPGVGEVLSDTAAPIAAGATEPPVYGLRDASVLILAPGVLFDVRTGGRLGKGGGFYDRFLAYHSREHRRRTSSSDAAAHVPPATTPLPLHHVQLPPPVPQWEVMAVAFDEQVLRIPRRATATAAAAAAVVHGGGEAEDGATRLGHTSETLTSADAPLLSSAAVPASMPERIPVAAHDQRMHCVASPSAGVEQVWAFHEC